MKRELYTEDFEQFWKNYPRTPVMSKKEAWTAWNKVKEDERPKILTAVRLYADWLAEQRRKRHDYPAVHACRFISQRRFDGFVPESKASIPEISTRVYARCGSKQLEAWDRYSKATKGRGLPRDSKGGWWVSAEWPPQTEGVMA